MGQDVSTARRELLEGENAERKEQLHILVKLANYKLDGYQYDLEKYAYIAGCRSPSDQATQDVYR